MLKCRDCKYFMKNEGGLELCTRNMSWEPTEPDRDCIFLPPKKELHCEDCWRYENDLACYGVSPEDSVYRYGELCTEFIDAKEDELYAILGHWKSCGLYDRDRINRLIDSFEESYADLDEQMKEK